MLVDDQDGEATPSLPDVRPEPLVAEIIRQPAEMSDDELGTAAAEAVDAALAARAHGAELALRAGELLQEAQHRCREQGVSWRDWLRRYWPKSRTTALAYLRIAQEVQQDVGRRADLLACQSVRQFLTDRGYGAGGTREKSEMREPGADEDEAPPETEEEKDAADERVRQRLAADALPTPRPHISPAEGARRAALAAEKAKRAEEEREAEKNRSAEEKAERQAELDAIDRARKNDPLKNPPTMKIPPRKGPAGDERVPERRPPPPPPVEVQGPVTPLWLGVADTMRKAAEAFVRACPVPRTDVVIDPIGNAYKEAAKRLGEFVPWFTKHVTDAAVAEAEMDVSK